MRNYKITNFLCDETYGGVYCFDGDYARLNTMVMERCELTLSKHYGTHRKFVVDDIEITNPLKKFKFIAWIESTTETKHLFVIGFCDSPETCVEEIYEMGDKHFENESEEFEY